MKQAIGWIIIFIVIISIGCTRNPTGAAVTADEITIGSILILTGEGASWGNAEKNGIDLAVADINAKGGINGKIIRVIHEDDQSNAINALAAFQKLTQADGVNIIIGTTWSHTGVPLVELADEQKVLMISPSLGLKEFNEGSYFLFNTWPHDTILAENLADYVFNKGVQKVAVIGAEQLWVKDQTNAFVKQFERLGGKSVVIVEPLPTDTNVLTDALKIKAVEDQVDAIVSTTDGVLVGAQVVKQLKKLGMELPLYSITIDQATIDASEGTYDGMEFLTFLTPTRAFEERYKEKFGLNIDIGADSAYDAVMLIAQAIKETNSVDPIVLAQFLNSLKQVTGVSGTLVSDGKGGFTKEFLVKRVVEGRAVVLELN